jgi:hypothetical protein
MSQSKKSKYIKSSMSLTDKLAPIFVQKQDKQPDKDDLANNDDLMKMVHMQASHLENLVLYIEEMNVALDQQK